MAYENGRSISKSRRLISVIIEVCDLQKLSAYLSNIDFEKAFDFMNHNFLIVIPGKYGFGENFIDWIKMLLTNQESCIIYGDHTRKYLNSNEELVRATHSPAPFHSCPGNSICYKSNKNILILNIFDNEYLYIAYAEDTTFFF